MGNLPVIHEVVTSVQSLGDVVTGNCENASNRWVAYASESIVGSGCAALHEYIHDNLEKANAYGRGMGRSTGKLILGGGMLSDVPGFQEMATAGASLGDVFAGEPEKARGRWTEEYMENSCVGSGINALIADSVGDTKRGDELRANCGRAWAKAGVTTASTVLTIGSGGLAAPLGAGASVAVGAVMGAVAGTGGTAANAAIDGREISASDCVSSGILGAATGAAAGYSASKTFQKSQLERVYRTIPEENGVSAVQNQRFPPGHNQTGPAGETCFSQSTTHQRQYAIQKNAAEPNLRFRTYQATLDKEFLKETINDAIPQHGSKAVNAELIQSGSNPKNVLTVEKLANHPGKKVNLNIKTPNLETFNDHIVKVKEINPSSFKHTHPNLKPIVRLGKSGAFAGVLYAAETEEK